MIKIMLENKRNILFIGLGIIIALVAVGIINGIKGGKASVKDAVKSEARTKTGTETPSISIDDDTVKGSESAPVTIIEFSDYECPFCARFYSETSSKIDEEYVKTGKVKYVYRDFPLSFHPHARKAAEASECADEQGKFWEYHDMLFENQNEWAKSGTSVFKEYAGRLGLDQGAFDACLDSGQMAEEVKKDIADGVAYGVTGTPAFFINGEMISGAQPFEVFRKVIEEKLCDSGEDTCSVDI